MHVSGEHLSRHSADKSVYCHGDSPKQILAIHPELYITRVVDFCQINHVGTRVSMVRYASLRLRPSVICLRFSSAIANDFS